MAWLSDGGKKFEYMCNRFNRIPACDRQTDGQTDRQTSCDGIVRAMHTRRAVKSVSERQKWSTRSLFFDPAFGDP